MDSPLHILAAARGVPPGTGCTCIVCGESPFSVGRPADKLLGPNFTDYEILRAPEATDACEGCCSILGGKPSKTDPPVRMLQVVAVPGEPLRVIQRADFEALLRQPIRRDHVIIWNDSMKRHASLRAGISNPDELRIGGDDGQVVYRPDEHMPLLDAVKTLRGGFARREIASGEYAPKKVSAFGPRRWERLDAVVARHRPSYLLDFLIGTLAAPETSTTSEDPEMISDTDRQAAALVRTIALHARVDIQWGVFHSGFARKRLVAAATRPTLADVVERFASSLATSPAGMAQALEQLEKLTPEEAADILAALRARPAIITTLAAQRPHEE